MRKTIATIFAFLILFCPAILFAQDSTSSSNQNNTKPADMGEIHGNFQADAQYYNPDSAIGAPAIPQKVLSNGFLNVNYTKGNFKAGFRYESYLDVMQGFDSRYKGTGIPYRYVTYTVDNLEITAGSFYEQFGTGLILRAYEERGLLLDNALDGVRVKFNPYKGIYLKGLIGTQRFFFGETGRVRGLDGEIQVNELLGAKWEEKMTHVMIGGSFVSKYQADQNPNLILPLNVGCYGGRFNIAHGRFNFYGEYAYKINDPSYDNKYVYKTGSAALFQASYSKKGTGLSLSLKKVDNMVYKADRDASGNVSFINYNPVLTKQHTYGLLAFYPYASQTNGEYCFQGELLHKFKKGTPLGGKYGMDISLNCSGAFAPDTTHLDAVSDSALIGYKENMDFNKISKQILYQDLSLEITKKFSPHFKVTAVYANQVYNIDIIQVKPGEPNIISNIAVLDMTYKYKEEKAIRLELQHLQTKQDKGSWAEALIEWTPGEKFYFTAMDQYNYANPNEKQRFHYVNVQTGYIKGTTRITLGYGKQRSGIFCAGGVCRYVPASNGFTLSITSSF